MKALIVYPAVLLSVLHLIAIAADFLAPYPYGTQHREAAFAPPVTVRCADTNRNECHVDWFVHGYQYQLPGVSVDRHLFGGRHSALVFLLGTDSLGRDQFSRLLIGSRISLTACWIAALASLCIGTTLGVIAGFHSGWVDSLIMRIGEASLSLPWLYLLLAARALLPLSLSPAKGYLMVIAILGLLGWAQPARIIRGVVLAGAQRGYVSAARAFGARDMYLMRVHLLPETLSAAAAQAAVLIPRYLVAEITLSFLGLGIGEPLPSWGNMLVGVQQYSILSSYWWMLVPAIAPAMVSLCCFAIGDALMAQRRAVPL